METNDLSVNQGTQSDAAAPAPHGAVDLQKESATDSATNTETSASPESGKIPLGKIVLWILAADAAWTLLTSVTPTIVVYQAAVLSHTNIFLALLATLTSFLSIFLSGFFFNLFFGTCFVIVFGGGAFVCIVAFSAIFGGSRK
ncbi:MAG: hypothetical protein HY986_10790 [Candidatus Melainabacteria bacterium]|nr:hypothetical protein [Candidatus Melainabacteria bacterium]